MKPKKKDLNFGRVGKGNNFFSLKLREETEMWNVMTPRLEKEENPETFSFSRRLPLPRRFTEQLMKLIEGEKIELQYLQLER